MCDRYGPVVVARETVAPNLEGVRVAIPGTLTTAFLALRLYAPGVQYDVMPFDRIQEAVHAGEAQAGLLIHEGQLTYDAHGLHNVVDLGEWWLLETGLPLPLGINVARRDLGDDMLHDLSEVLRASIAAGLESREEALSYALQYGRGLDRRLADRFVGMYVNNLTEDYGDEGREAVGELLRRGEQIGAFEQPVRVDFVS